MKPERVKTSGMGPKWILRTRARGSRLDKGELCLERRCHVILFTDILQTHPEGSDGNSVPPRRVDHPLHNFGMHIVFCKDDFVNGHFPEQPREFPVAPEDRVAAEPLSFQSRVLIEKSHRLEVDVVIIENGLDDSHPLRVSAVNQHLPSAVLFLDTRQIIQNMEGNPGTENERE